MLRMPRNDGSIFVKDVLETITCQVKPGDNDKLR